MKKPSPSTADQRYAEHFRRLHEAGNWRMELRNTSVSDQVLASPSLFARQNLIYLESIVLNFVSPQGFSVHRKNYNSYQIVYTLSGHALLHTLDRQYTLFPGSCFLIDCKEDHHYYVEDPEVWLHHGIQFNGHIMPPIFEQLKKRDSIVIAMEDAETIQQIHQKLAAAAKSQLTSADITIHQLLTDLVSRFLLANQILSESQLSPKILRVCEYIDANFPTIRSIDEIAEKCYISKYHMCREFKRQTGKTVVTYLSEKRMQTAKLLLETNVMQVSQIAREVGFESENYFYSVFKKLVGCTPLQYAKQLRGDG